MLWVGGGGRGCKNENVLISEMMYNKVCQNITECVSNAGGGGEKKENISIFLIGEKLKTSKRAYPGGPSCPESPIPKKNK